MIPFFMNEEGPEIGVNINLNSNFYHKEFFSTVQFYLYEYIDSLSFDKGFVNKVKISFFTVKVRIKWIQNRVSEHKVWWKSHTHFARHKLVNFRIKSSVVGLCPRYITQVSLTRLKSSTLYQRNKVYLKERRKEIKNVRYNILL